MERKIYSVTYAPIILVFLLLIGCIENKNVNELKQDLDSAKLKITELETQLKNIENRILNLEFQNTKNNIDDVAYLTPGSKILQNIRFGLGNLTVLIKDITPYANGSKVTLRFGNILSAQIHGLKVKIEYGMVDEKGETSQKSKEVTFNEILQSGSWTDVNVILDGIPSEKLSFVRLKEVTYRGITLITQR